VRYTVARRLTAAGFLGLLVAGRYLPEPWVRGSGTSVRWMDTLLIVDPLAALENLLASGTAKPEVLIGAGLLVVLSALLLGRAFCGWICPLGLLLDLSDGLRKRFQSWRRKHGKPPFPNWVGPKSLKYYLLLFCLLLTLASGLPIFQSISPINWVVWLAVFSADLGWGAAMVHAIPLLMLMASEWFSRRLWCRALCPLGALYSIIGRFGLWKIQINSETAGQLPCGKCTRNCSMGIDVMESYTMQKQRAILDSECTRCGDCIQACPNEVLSQGTRSQQITC
jgi:ferredoxin-type protein NapH